MNRYEIALGKDPPEEELHSQPIEKPSKKVEDARESRLSELLRSAGGRRQLADSMVQPLRQRLDYGSLARRALRVESLPDGALPRFANFSGATAVDESGQNIITLPRFNSEFNSAIIPIFEVSSNPTFPLAQLRERRFDLIERAQDYASTQIRQIEDSLFVRLLSNNLSSSTTTFSGTITREAIADSFNLIEQHDLRVANFFMNSQGYETVNRVGDDLIDRNWQRDLIQQGVMGSLWGAQIILSESVPQGEFYMTAEPEFVGVLPVRTDLTVISADDPGRATVGWSMFENIGMACHNPMGVVRITFNPQTDRTDSQPSRVNYEPLMVPLSFVLGSRTK